jgi:hypothetical protein
MRAGHALTVIAALVTTNQPRSIASLDAMMSCVHDQMIDVNAHAERNLMRGR